MLKTNVIEHFGSATKVARFLSITPIAVHYWGDVIPKGRATELHLLTSGELVYDTAHYQKDQADGVRGGGMTDKLSNSVIIF